jgi:hypothetical protein
VGLKLSGTHQIVVYADDVNLVGDNINTMKKIIEALTDPSKKLSLEITTQKTT